MDLWRHPSIHLSSSQGDRQIKIPTLAKANTALVLAGCVSLCAGRYIYAQHQLVGSFAGFCGVFYYISSAPRTIVVIIMNRVSTLRRARRSFVIFMPNLLLWRGYAVGGGWVMGAEEVEAEEERMGKDSSYDISTSVDMCSTCHA